MSIRSPFYGRNPAEARMGASFLQKEKSRLRDFFGGERGIRTLGRLLAEHTISSRAP